MKITFITSNPAKAEQLSRHLNVPIEHQKIELDEIQSLDLHQIVEYKARQAFAIIQSPVLIEDTSLTFNALGHLPGPLIKWFLNELGNDGLCTILNGYTDRSAKAEVLFGLFDGHGLKTYYGSADGSVSLVKRGEQGFGWDPVFIPAGYDKTWGEMSIEEQGQTSMRKIALKKLEDDLA
jgi:non-canonical purine NTP pyrophosphatase (RdgB/HAM1 family)